MFKPLKTIPLALLAMAGSAEALTLGQIHVQSFINEPLKAIIDVNKASADELKALKVRLANRSSFGKAGIDFTSDIQQLRFSVIESPTGTKIEVTTPTPISEPFLSFVIDADWNKGSVSKDYTVLLDPPIYTDRFAAPVAPADAGIVRRDEVEAPKPKAEEAKKPEPEKVAEKKPAPPKEKPAKKPAVAAGSEDAFGPTVRGNNLWTVAKTNRPGAATIQQTMVAIQEANPDAFMRGNMNLMKQGQLLRIPPDEVIEAISQIAAENRVKQHQRAWKNGKAIARAKRLSPEVDQVADNTPGATPADTDSAATAGLVKKGQPGNGDATGTGKPGDSSSPTAAATETVDEGRLTLASAGKTASDSANGDPAQQSEQMEALKGDLIKAREDALSAQEESKELRERNEMLEDQLDSQKKLIQLQNEQLSKLQEFYRQLNEQQEAGEDLEMPKVEGLETAVASDSDTTSETEAALEAGTTDAMQDSATAAMEETPAEESATDPESETTATEESSMTAAVDSQDESIGTDTETPADDTEIPSDTAMMTADSSEAPTTAATETESTEAATADTETETAETESETVAEETPEKNESSFVAGLMKNEMALYGGAATGIGILGLLGLWILRRRKSTDDGFDDDDILAAELASNGRIDDEIDLYDETVPESASAGVSTPDPLDRINPLIAYKDYDQAKELLEEAILDEPERFDLHLKMMDVMHASGDKQGFEEHMQILEAANLEAIDAEAWAKIQEQRDELASSGGGAAAAATAAVAVAGATAAEAFTDKTKDASETAGDVIDEIASEMPAIDDEDIDLFPGVEEEAALDKIAKLDTSLDDISFEDIEKLPDLGNEEIEGLDLNLGEETESDEETDTASIAEDLDLGEQEDLESALKLFELELEERDSDTESVTDEAHAALTETAEILATDDLATDETETADSVEEAKDTVLEEVASEVDDTDLDFAFGEVESGEPEALDDSESDEMEELEESFSLDDFSVDAEEPKVVEEFALPENEPEPETATLAEAEAEKPEESSQDNFDVPEVSEEEVQAKVELAEAFAEMGDVEGAREILDEVLREGNDNQRNTAQEILQRYAS